MVVLHCTQRLLHRLLVSHRDNTARSTTVLGDWCGNMFFMGRRRILIFVSERSRLPVLMPSRNLARLPETFPLAVSEVLRAIRVPEPKIMREMEAMAQVLFAPTNNRSLLGTINDYKIQLRWYFSVDPEHPLLPLALKLSETIVGPLKYGHPSEVTRRWFDTD